MTEIKACRCRFCRHQSTSAAKGALKRVNARKARYGARVALRNLVDGEAVINLVSGGFAC